MWPIAGPRGEGEESQQRCQSIGAKLHQTCSQRNRLDLLSAAIAARLCLGERSSTTARERFGSDRILWDRSRVGIYRCYPVERTSGGTLSGAENRHATGPLAKRLRDHGEQRIAEGTLAGVTVIDAPLRDAVDVLDGEWDTRLAGVTVIDAPLRGDRVELSAHSLGAGQLSLRRAFFAARTSIASPSLRGSP